ncbi:hypothetical protein P152DRAFT_474950 [Eremomyces bilateralis CBS 781.70]|uniref:Actin cytoskeleton-regulatory complex protein SLA1 n=1 Tax=Eremomyces bilateralis CBS 781.70 TaxID=1392243 RepID=A0A6G1G0A3_9PEZI|nr:uncharacterized protein P152DRAFT_474950 [Eremomyces bilateralis CBS 781.70]KAF1811356.1 hypothetical protein P152DRAFT_474950 [Eremomyces bilateralis CBS 781.70]
MGFEGVYRAIYDYAPQGEGELEIQDGDLLFVLDKSADDGWWKAKKKAADEGEEEPEGLIPNNYVEEATASNKAKALYDYTRQTDEELSFTEESLLDVYDTSDPDWTLVGFNGEFGFVPSNYIEEAEDDEQAPPKPARPPAAPALPRAAPVEEPESIPPSPDTPTQSPAAALAGILAQKTGGGDDVASRYSAPARDSYARESRPVPPPPAEDEDAPPLPSRSVRFAEEEEDTPQLPRRPPSEVSPPPMSPMSPISPTFSPTESRSTPPPRNNFGGSFKLFNIYQVKSALGKEHKIKSVLGIDVRNCRIMVSEIDSGGGQKGKEQVWDGSHMTNYSIEGKRVFIVVIRPSHEFHIHAGNTETAEEITRMLGEISGAVRSQSELGPMAEILNAAQGNASRKKSGIVKFDFSPNDADEIAVQEGDHVEILDDRSSEEWWKVQNMRTGDEGVVPAQYVELTAGGLDTRSTVEKNRAEEERQARGASKRGHKKSENGSVGPGLPLPQRGSSLMRDDPSSRSGSQRKSKRGSTQGSSRAEKPNPAKVRQWTDRTESFKVDAEFLGLREGKIHLHKLNGVRIAVPVSKMSMVDIEYVEDATGVSLDEDKPLSEIRSKNSRRGSPTAGASIDRSAGSKYDWFDFFLACGVNPQICERYNQAFKRDQMGEETMEAINPQTLRTLGIKEGDILRIMKYLDSKFNRGEGGGANGSAGGLFSGPGGTLLNNTKKGRPAPPVETNNTVDADAFRLKDEKEAQPEDAKPTPIASGPPPPEKDNVGGFDDNAWEPRKSKSAVQVSSAPVSSPSPAVTGSLAELSLLSPPLQPTIAQPAQPSPPTAAPDQAVAPAQPAQPTGATPSLFDQLAQAPPQGLNVSRQRPAPPQQTTGNSLIAPPPARASSAPNAQQNAFQPPPLQPQLTGYHSGVIHAQPSGPGQSMIELNQQKMAQQYAQMQPQPTGFQPQFGPNGMPMSYPNAQFQQPQSTGFQPQPTGFQPQPTGFQPQPTGFQPQPTNLGNQSGSPFADPPRAPFQPQPTGFQSPSTYSPSPLHPQPTGINAFLPPALQPQPTGFQASQPTGFQPPPVPPIPQSQPAAQPLQPQKTGPPPPVRFGVAGQKKLAPQPTGRRANLSQATPNNPFGF